MAGSAPKTECPLRDPDLGIVSENDHQVDRCLCQFCTCGTHICPKVRLNPYSPLNSKYRTDFQHCQRLPKQPHKSSPSYSPPRHRMESQTTHKADFVEFKEVEPGRRFQLASPKKSLDLVSTSSNRQAYPNWGAIPVEFVKEWHPPVRGSEVRFQGVSAYQEAFRDLPVPVRRKVTMNASLPFGPKKMIELESTYAHTMKHSGDLGFGSTPKAASTYQPTKLPTRFLTTAHQVYQPTKPTLKDPRQVRLALLTRS